MIRTYTVHLLPCLSVSMFPVLADTQVLREVDKVAASASYPQPISDSN